MTAAFSGEPTNLQPLRQLHKYDSLVPPAVHSRTQSKAEHLKGQSREYVGIVPLFPSMLELRLSVIDAVEIALFRVKDLKTTDFPTCIYNFFTNN